MDAEDEWLSHAEACRYLRTSKSSLNRLIQEHPELKHKFGRATLLKLEELRRLPQRGRKKETTS